jgi:hypothetical protein
MRSIGRLHAVTGVVAITRGAVVARPVVGDALCQGDVIETGVDGAVAITFEDGTQLRLCAGTRAELNEFPHGAQEAPGSAPVYIVSGRFEFIDPKPAAADHLTIGTPLGELRNRRPGFGAGTVALGIFTFAFIPELKADSADVALIDNGLIDYKALKHGIFEIITKGDNPQRIIVDDPMQTVILRARGSSVSISEVTNTPAQMAQLQNAYRRCPPPGWRDGAVARPNNHIGARRALTGIGIRMRGRAVLLNRRLRF